MTTEWDDVLIEKGIIEAIDKMDLPPPSMPVYDISQKLGDYSSSSSEGDSSDEDLLEDDVLEMYKNRRLQEIKSELSLLKQISKSDYVTATQSDGVVAILLSSTQEKCEKVEKMLQNMVATRNIKAFKMKSTDCIPNYPDKNVPTILLYFNRDLVASLVRDECFSIEKRVESLLNK